MGTWDAGVFDNDSAIDHAYEFTGKMIKEIDEAVANPSDLECDEYWGDRARSEAILRRDSRWFIVEQLSSIVRAGYASVMCPEQLGQLFYKKLRPTDGAALRVEACWRLVWSW